MDFINTSIVAYWFQMSSRNEESVYANYMILQHIGFRCLVATILLFSKVKLYCSILVLDVQSQQIFYFPLMSVYCSILVLDVQSQPQGRLPRCLFHCSILVLDVQSQPQDYPGFDFLHCSILVLDVQSQLIMLIYWCLSNCSIFFLTLFHFLLKYYLSFCYLGIIYTVVFRSFVEVFVNIAVLGAGALGCLLAAFFIFKDAVGRDTNQRESCLTRRRGRREYAGEGKARATTKRRSETKPVPSIRPLKMG